jgi:hypothetical protein
MRACTRQPQGVARVNYANPLASALGGLWTFGDGTIHNLVTNEIGSTNACSFVPTSKGVALATTSTTSYAVLAQDWRSVFGASSGTVLVWCEKRDATFRAGRIISADVSPTAFVLQTYTNGTTLYYNWPGFNDNQGTTVSGDRIFGTSVGANVKAYNNGVLIKTTPGTANIAAASSGALKLGDDVTGDTAELLNYYVVATWKRQLADVDVAEFSRNPWQIFADPRWLYTGMGSGSWTPLEVTG